MVTQVYGTTESGSITVLVPPREHWNTFAFDEDSGVEMEPLDPKDPSSICEAVIKPIADKIKSQPAFVRRPELKEYRTHDLFQKHETEPDLWHYRGRADDVVVLSTGDKVVPSTLENMARNTPNIGGALVFGTMKIKPGLLLLLNDPGKETETIEELWRRIEKLNEDTPRHSTLLRQLILIASPEKPFIMVDKGTVARAATFKLYELEIEKAYQALSQGDYQ